jgi:hypothetical protein
MPRAADLSTATSGLLSSLRLHATHLLICRSVLPCCGFWSSAFLVFVFVVFLLLCLGCNFVVLLLPCVHLFCMCCNFCVFSFILLSVLHHLPAITWFVFEVEMWVLAFIWFFAVLALQLSFFSDGCFTRIGLFTEFLCNLHRLVRLWNRPGLPLVLLELLVNTIAFGSFGPDPEFVLIFALLFIIWAMLLGRPPLSFWVYCWGAHPIFVYRISHFFFLSDQK